jgi:hypothetical protein
VWFSIVLQLPEPDSSLVIGVALEASRIGTRQGDDIVDSATESNDRCKAQGRRLVHPSLELDILE